MFPPDGLGSGLENPQPFFTNCKRGLEAQSKRGRYFSMVLHTHMLAFAHRMRLLATLFSHPQDFPGLWNPRPLNTRTTGRRTTRLGRPYTSSPVSGRTIPAVSVKRSFAPAVARQAGHEPRMPARPVLPLQEDRHAHVHLCAASASPLSWYR